MSLLLALAGATPAASQEPARGGGAPQYSAQEWREHQERRIKRERDAEAELEGLIAQAYRKATGQEKQGIAEIAEKPVAAKPAVIARSIVEDYSSSILAKIAEIEAILMRRAAQRRDAELQALLASAVEIARAVEAERQEEEDEIEALLLS